MPSGMENAFLMVAIGEFVIGMLGNGFIVLVNCIDWMKGKKLSLTDCITTSLAISRIGHLCIIVFDSSVMVLWPHLYAINELTTFIGITWTLNNHLATWLATCLSVFYFFKIANFSQPCFAWLRWRITRVLLVLPLVSLVLLFTDLQLIDAYNGFWNIYVRNLTWSSGVRTVYINSMVTANLIELIPFLLSLSSLLLLFLSLMKHSRNLQLNSRDLGTVAHKRAMKMVMSFLFLFMVHFSSSVIIAWTFLEPEKYQIHFAVMLTVTIFPSVHSFILILGNNRLQQTAFQLLRQLKCHLKRVKPIAS